MQHSLVYTPEYEKESQMLLTIIRRSTQVDRYEYPAALFVVPIDSDSQQSTTIFVPGHTTAPGSILLAVLTMFDNQQYRQYCCTRYIAHATTQQI